MIRKEHRLSSDVPIVFIEAKLGDTSDFYQTPLVEVLQEEGCFIIRVKKCAEAFDCAIIRVRNLNWL